MTPAAPPAAPALPDDDPLPAPDEDPLPTPEELEAAPDATIRHAPKFGAFIIAGALVGIVVGLLATALAGPESLVSDGSGLIPLLDGENAVRAVVAISGAVLGGFVGGL